MIILNAWTLFAPLIIISICRLEKKYDLDEEPIHLWADYDLGDADEEKVLTKAKKHGFEDISTLLDRMDFELLELAEDYSTKE